MAAGGPDGGRQQGLMVSGATGDDRSTDDIPARAARVSR